MARKLHRAAAMMRAILPALIACAACGHDPQPPPGENGWIGGVWTGNLTHADDSVAVALWIEQDGDAVAGAAVQQTAAAIPGQPLSAPADLPCAALDRDPDGALRYRMPTDQGADLLVAVSLDPATHALVGQWAADTDLTDTSGDVTLTRVAWLPTRFAPGETAPDSRRTMLGCVPRPTPACADGVDNDGDGAIDGDDLGCCLPHRPCVLVGNREDAEPPCANRIDDDFDGVADANDPECGSPAGDEIGRDPACGDGWDNDGDGAIDLADAGCAGNPRRASEVEPMCGDGRDNDSDGAIDAADPDCARYDAEAPPGADCADGYDDDGDGLIDLADPSCHGQAWRPDEYARGTCDDGIDNDGDGAIDLAEPTCSAGYYLDEDGSFTTATDCTDGADNDGDGAIDAADPSCFWFGEGDEVTAAPDPGPARPLGTCGDGVDSDGDARIDYADPDCDLLDPLAGIARFEAVPACQDGVDDDGDGAVDAADPDCAGPFQATEAAGTGATPPRECDDGRDNDGDGAVDAEDPDCQGPEDWSEAAACADGRDNDNDGRFDSADPGCTGSTDDDER